MGGGGGNRTNILDVLSIIFLWTELYVFFSIHYSNCCTHHVFVNKESLAFVIFYESKLGAIEITLHSLIKKMFSLYEETSHYIMCMILYEFE